MASESSNFLFSLLNLDRKSLFQHHNIYCDVCSRSITGIRRKCLTCADIDVCNDCYLRGSHLSQIKYGHNPSSCVFVEIHNQEQTDNFNVWMKGRSQPPPVVSSVVVDIPTTVSAPMLPSPHGPTLPSFSTLPSFPVQPTIPPTPFSQLPVIPLLPGPFGPSVPMMPIPTPRGPVRPLFEPQIFPIHSTFPEHNRPSNHLVYYHPHTYSRDDKNNRRH